jgi:hypothetical protein
LTAPIDFDVSKEYADANEPGGERGTNEWRYGERARLEQPAPAGNATSGRRLESNAHHHALHRHRIDGDGALRFARYPIYIRV